MIQILISNPFSYMYSRGQNCNTFPNSTLLVKLLNINGYTSIYTYIERIYTYIVKTNY